MKIPTQEFLLALEIFAEFCGCQSHRRGENFLKNCSLLHLFQYAYYEERNVLWVISNRSHVLLFHLLNV